MKKSYICGIALAALAPLAACDDNAWNNKLDGFDGDEPITDVQSIEYPLTDADYAAIASNSENKNLAGEDGAKALAAVGTQHYFTPEITAAKYVPAFLASTSFPYFTLSEGSAVKLTYNVAQAMPAEIASLLGADAFIIDTDSYEWVWGSDDNFINGFAPSKPASKYVPILLADNFDDAEPDTYVMVTYSQADQEPIFGNVGGEEEQPNFTHVVQNAIISGHQYVIVAEGVAGLCPAEEKSYGWLTKLEVAEEEGGIIMDPANPQALFRFTGSADKGYYIQDTYGRYLWMDETHDSFQVSAELPEAAALWSVEFLSNLDVRITNIDRSKTIQYSPDYGSYGAYATEKGVLPSLYTDPSVNSPLRAPVAAVPLTTRIAMWHFDGSSWSQPSDVVILQPSDYTDMGQKYQNLSNNTPDTLLPIFLSKKFPYAQADDQKFVMYQYYASGSTAYRCDQYTYDGSAWVKNNGVAKETSQFVLNDGAWMYDPSVTINLPATRGAEPSLTYYQTCVNWVYENIDKPLGSTSITSGKFYVTSYGNNEYYSGASAYYNNVDIRGAKAKEQYPAGYEGMTDAQAQELMKERFCYEVLPGALKILHSDAVPVEGIDVLYTVNFIAYDGSNLECTVVYKVTGPAEFEMQNCNWWADGKPAE